VARSLYGIVCPVVVAPIDAIAHGQMVAISIAGKDAEITLS
jgi:hypothetical protein